MVTAVRRDRISPSYQQGFARGPSKSARPQDWEGLVGLWIPSLGPSGGTLRDWSGFGNHGALTGMDLATDWVVDGEQGYTLDFDGSNDFINLVNPTALKLNNLTFAVRIKLTTWSNRPTLVGRLVDADNFVLLVLQNTSGNVEKALFRVKTSGTESGAQSAQNIVKTDIWYHIFGTADGTNVKVYVNGEERASASQTVTPITTGNMEIGRPGSSTFFTDFTGLVSSVMIWNRALMGNHIRDITDDPMGIVRLKRRRQFHSIQAAPAVGWGPLLGEARNRLIQV